MKYFPHTCLERIDSGTSLDFTLELLKSWTWVNLDVPWPGAANYSVLNIALPVSVLLYGLNSNVCLMGRIKNEFFQGKRIN